MKGISLAFLIVLTMGICMGQVPNLVGNWTASGDGYVDGDGFQELPEGSLIFCIVEQNGRLFMGNVTFMEGGVEKAEVFAGAIGLDNRTLYRVEFDEGYSFGTIISNDEIEMIYLQDGKMGRIFIDKLHRMEE